MIYDLNVIFQNGPTDIQDQIDALDNTIKAIDHIREQVKSTGYYCKMCNRWYRKDDCGLVEEVETKMVCTNPFNGYLDDYEYEERTQRLWFDACPQKHKLNNKARFYL